MLTLISINQRWVFKLIIFKIKLREFNINIFVKYSKYKIVIWKVLFLKKLNNLIMKKNCDIFKFKDKNNYCNDLLRV